MKLTLMPEIPEALTTHFTRLAAGGASREQVIYEMRLAGLNILDSMKLFQELYGVSRQEAKAAVHFSQAWADRRDAHETLHDAAAEAVNMLQATHEHPTKISA